MIDNLLIYEIGVLEHLNLRVYRRNSPFLKQFFFTGMFFIFYFYKDENQNASKLQGRIAYLSIKICKLQFH